MRMHAASIAVRVALAASIATLPFARSEPDFAVAEGEYAPGAGTNVRYLTPGLPTHDETGLITNAVLALPEAKQLRSLLADPFASALFAPGQPLDPRRYYVVIADAGSADATYVFSHLSVTTCASCSATAMAAITGGRSRSVTPFVVDALVAFDCVPGSSANLRRSAAKRSRCLLRKTAALAPSND